MSDRRRRERRINTIVFCCTVALIPLAFWGVTSLADNAVDSLANGPDCDSFEFDPDRWGPDADRDDVGEQADGLSECGVLVRMRQRGVVAMLGEPTLATHKRLVYEIRRGNGDVARPRFVVVLQRGAVRQSFFHDTTVEQGSYGTTAD